MAVLSVLQRYVREIEAEIKSVIGESPLGLYSMMRYHLGWEDEHGRPRQVEGGKRLRPTLCLLACEAVGGDYHQALPAAASLELLHNFSLIHDDIQDKSPERRHQAAVWWIWGPAQGINAGDGMYVLAGIAMLRLAERGVPSEKVLRAARLLGEASLKLCEGQHLDVSYENRLDVGVEAYTEMVAGKTAALLGCSMEVGALVGTDDEGVIERFGGAGRNLGMAFQIRDDVLDLWGGDLGKRASDIQSKKKTLPVIYGMEKAEGGEKDELLQFYRGNLVTDEDVMRIVTILEKLGAQEYAQRMAWRYCQKAVSLLEETGLSSEAMAQLKELANFLVERTY